MQKIVDLALTPNSGSGDWQRAILLAYQANGEIQCGFQIVDMDRYHWTISCIGHMAAQIRITGLSITDTNFDRRVSANSGWTLVNKVGHATVIGN